MANTFTKIATVTVGSGGASTIDFTSIPSTYTDICILASLRDAGGSTASNLSFTLNSSTSSFSGRWFGGNGTAAINGTWTAPSEGAIPAQSATASIFGNLMMYIPNYASSNYKPISTDSVSENNSATGYNWFDALLWSNTNAITGVSFNLGASSFTQYSSATLYGIKNS